VFGEIALDITPLGGLDEIVLVLLDIPNDEGSGVALAELAWLVIGHFEYAEMI
jgi:hypothetical protein